MKEKSVYPRKTRSSYIDGMSLREYFAGQALAGLTANYIFLSVVHNDAKDNGVDTEELIAVRAYELADAMLEECKD